MIRTSSLSMYCRRGDLPVEWLEDGYLCCDRMITAMRAESGLATGDASVCAWYEPGEPKHGDAGTRLTLDGLVSVTSYLYWPLAAGPEWVRHE